MATLKNQVLSLVKRGDFEESVALARLFVEQNPASAESWGILAHAYEITGDVESAIQAENHAVELAPDEPSHWFQRGWLHLLVDASRDSLGDMKKVLDLSQSLSNDYYTEMAAFLAAESLRRLHRYDEALEQCATVREDFSVYVGMPLSKTCLVMACARALRHTESIAA
jgi:tetratricopeptide (TPR) repeat protein